jgi:hypothetical protein
VAACHARPADKLAGPRPGGPAQRGKRPVRPAATRTLSVGAVTTHRPRAGWRGGVLAGGSVVARRQQGVARDLEGATGKVPSKEERAGAHRNGGSTVRRRKRRWAAMFNGGGVAPVVVDVRGGVLQHRCGRGREI